MARYQVIRKRGYAESKGELFAGGSAGMATLGQPLQNRSESY